MNFNEHSLLAGRHAFLSPSNYHWINYTEDKLTERYSNHLAAQRGTELHEFASQAIRLGIKLPRTSKTLNMYINDAIGFKMKTEQTLFYSDNCFGTADAISFRKSFLRIHDYKSGATKSSMKQLEIYAALFCLEYNYKPSDIGIELRLYQLDEVLVHEPEPEVIFEIMNTIVMFDKRIEQLKLTVGKTETTNASLTSIFRKLQEGVS